MKKYLMIMTMVLTVHAVMADGVFIVNKDFKAYDWEEFDGSCGTPIGIYVESKGCTLMSSMTYPYCTLADAKAREAKYSEEAHLARMFEFMTMSDVRDLFNKAMNKIWDISGKYMMDYRDPVSDHGLWLSNGKIGYYYYEDGMKYESERNPEENEQSYALLLFNDSFKNRVIKYKNTQVPRESGKITASASVKQVDSSKLSGQESQSASSTKMTAQDGIYIVNGYLKAWPWEQYDESNGKPVGIYVEQNGSAVFTDIHCSYRGSTDMINLESSVREIGQHLPETRNDIRLLYNNCDEFNEAFGKAYKLSGQNMANYVDPIGGQRCLWLRDGHVSFFDCTELPDRDSQTYFMALFDDKYVAKVAKQAMPSHPLKLTRTGKSSQTQKSVQSQKPTVQRGGQAGTLKATATVRTIDKSGAHYQNRGYTYTNLIEDVTVTLSNINAYFRNTPSGMPEGGCPIIRVFLVRFLPNGNPETVGTYDIDVLPDPVKDEWKSPQTQTVRFKTPWNKLWNRYGQGTVKYQYQIVIPRKAGPELIYKTPVRQITITNIPQPRR